MKQEKNNEVDLLLRSLARQREKSGSGNGLSLGASTESFSEHLDADELNSYAEGVVPEPARGRYLEHLADCESCRRIVVDLSQAAGVTARYEVAQPQGGSSFWQKILALFSPAVLRFGVPVLVLTAVIGIGFVALLQQRRSEHVALRTENEPRLALEPATNNQAANPAPSATVAPTSGFVDKLETRNPAEATKLQDKQPVAAKELAAPTDSRLAKDGLSAGERGAAGSDLITSQPYAPEPKADAPAAPLVVPGAVQKSADDAMARSEKREDQDRSRDAFRNKDEEHGPSRSRNNAATPTAQRSMGGLSGRGPNVDKKKVGEVETRSISGRRFTREDNAWVDTDYSAPRATTVIKRGSEQFRSLIADEPGIRAIADQLGGVVIVVWKNRAYRIQ